MAVLLAIMLATSVHSQIIAVIVLACQMFSLAGLSGDSLHHIMFQFHQIRYHDV